MVRDTADRRRAFRLGLDAESKAAWLLRFKGYRSLARRLRMPGGEADLVASRGAIIAFVEVKARATREAAAEAISPHQRHRIMTAAQWWLSRNPGAAEATIRFDAVLVVRRHWPLHIPDAFQAD